MIDNNDSASALPIKDEAELAIEARAQQLMRQYDISMEEALRMARGEMLESMEAPPQQPAAEDRLAAQYQAAGMSPERAARIARNEAAMYGERAATAKATEQDSDYGRERLAGVAQQLEADDARHQQMYDNYFRATGAPSHQQIPAEEAARDEYRQRYNALFDSYRRDGVHSQQPIDPGTPEQNERWDAFLESNPEQMQRFRPDDYAAMEAAKREKHMADVFKNIRQKYGPDEEARARAAYAEGKVHVPQTDDQRSRNEARRNLEAEAMRGNDESRQRLRAMEAGVNYDDPGMTDEDRAALRAPGGNMSDSRRAAMMRRLRVQAGVTGQPGAEGKTADQLRELIAAKRAAEAQAKELLWRPRTMIRGGNAIGALALPGMNDWQNQAIAGGPTPLAVDAVGAQNALRMMNAEALAGMDPARRDMQREVMEQRRQLQEASLPADQKIALSRSRREPMGSGLSAGPVQEAWNGAMTEAGFRRQMEGQGYSLAEIDAWIDARRNSDDKQSGLAAGPAIAGRGGHAGGGEMFGPGGGL